MKVPNVQACIVAEGIREEIRGKLTINGVFGLMPNVDILVKDPSKPIPDILMLFLTHPMTETGEFNLKLEVKAPDGKSIIEAQLKNLPVVEEDIGQVARYIFKFSRTKFERMGKYSVTLKADDQDLFNSTFTVGPYKG